MALRLNTNQKLKIAQCLNRVVCGLRKACGRPNRGVFKRKGIHWGLDLNEGIDFSIFLLGAFEPADLKTYTGLIKPGDIILDIGANVGAHTLHFARLTGPRGQVFAFEATEFAFDKMRENLRLNPELSKVVEPWHALLNSGASGSSPSEIYSSWPLHATEQKHQHHGGALKTVGHASVISLDEFIHKKNLKRVDFIKIDVDGNEYEVLQGATKLLSNFKPTILIELSPHVHDEKDPSQWDKLISLLVNSGYIFESIKGEVFNQPTSIELRKLIPINGSLNFIMKPKATR
ncbi:MAG: FkbM family methyltransferase [Verrucomicrobiota bacterium]|nr:FkbM family methyltransferase [Verrucomicrobiota bacterium]